MSYNYANPPYTYPPAFTTPYAQPPQSYPSASIPPPTIQNPFPTPSASSAAQPAAYDASEEAQLAQWQSAYAAPPDPASKKDARNPNTTALGPRAGLSDANPHAPACAAPGEKSFTVVRAGGGETWTDATLLEWDPTHFRIMVGNLAGEVTDDSLAKAFEKYGVSKARVVRDKRTTKSKGFGFVSFGDGELGFRAAREMAGKYIGSHPITVQRSKVDVRPRVERERRGKGRGRREKDAGEGEVLRKGTGAGVEKRGRGRGGYKVIG